MQQLSYNLTWWRRWRFPIFWFASLGLLELVFMPWVLRGENSVWILTVPLGFAAMMCVMLKLTPHPLVDEVWLDGDELIVRWRQQEDRIPLLDIDWIRTGAVGAASKSGISLHLKRPSLFGNEIHFIAKGFMWPPAEEQIRRAHLKVQQK